MCDYEEYTRPLKSRNIKKSRKEWRCDICGVTFPVGTPRFCYYGLDIDSNSIFEHNSCVEPNKEACIKRLCNDD